jgi:hypothetical protein
MPASALALASRGAVHGLGGTGELDKPDLRPFLTLNKPQLWDTSDRYHGRYINTMHTPGAVNFFIYFRSESQIGKERGNIVFIIFPFGLLSQFLSQATGVIVSLELRRLAHSRLQIGLHRSAW